MSKSIKETIKLFFPPFLWFLIKGIIPPIVIHIGKKIKASLDETYTKDYHVFLRKVAAQQKHTNYSEYWSKMKAWNYSELFPERYKIKIDFFNALVIPRLKKDFIMADIACASGEFSFFFSKYVAHIDAFDLSPAMINYAKQKCDNLSIKNINFFNADLQTALINKSYNVILMLGLLTYIYDEEKVKGIIGKIHEALGGGVSSCQGYN